MRNMPLLRSATLIILAVALTACSTSINMATATPDSTRTNMPALLSNSVPSPIASPGESRSSPTQTLAALVANTPITIAMDNGLSWTECVVPNRDYSLIDGGMAILKKCVDPSEGSVIEVISRGERVKGNSGFDDLRISIGNDRFETKLTDRSKDGFQYELTKNGEVVYKTITHFMTVDPNQNLWNIDGKLVWELAGSRPVIIVDGVDFNEKYQLEGSFFPYEINGKLIFVAEKNEKFSIMYDEKIIGPEFDDISMPYCCAMVPLIRGNGQYWFVGSRGGGKYLVSIRSAADFP